MRSRGRVYWDWAHPTLHFRNYDELVHGGILINVQVRLSNKREVQLFLGVYGPSGVLLLEEAFDDRAEETMTKAMEWGINRAKEFVKF